MAGPVHLCPHCAVRATFTPLTQAGTGNDEHPLVGVLQCDHCRGIVFASSNSSTFIPSKLLWPAAQEEAPEDYPEDVRDNYREAVRSFQAGNYKACVIMVRGALQAAARGLQAKGSSLYQEIEDLAKRHVIPDALKDWAHELRDGGNLVAHPEPGKRVGKEDAAELLALAESIFEYLYVVPAEVQRRRQRVGQQATP